MSLSILILSVLLLTSRICPPYRNKNNSNAYDITNPNEEKTVKAVLVDSAPISAPGNYNEVNLHLAETINSTIAQFKILIEKTRKFTEDNDFTVNDRANSSLKM